MINSDNAPVQQITIDGANGDGKVEAVDEGN